MVWEGIQIKKLSVPRQADSLFGDEDLIRLGDGELEGIVEDYFGSDAPEALDHLFKRRSSLLQTEDQRKYQREYHKRRKLREYRIPLRLNYEKDADIIEFLEQSDNRTALIRQVLREYVDKEKGAK